MERCVCLVLIVEGCSLGIFSGDVKLIKDDLATLRPTLFISVPRIYNKFYGAIKG